uniref:Condensin-2 complex subunit G2 n=1 Tax=Acrobeloides nanus TaxID=290746 RepID=A0A914DHM9_9BILA
MSKNSKPVIDVGNWKEDVLQLPKPSKIKVECKRLAKKIIEENVFHEIWTIIKKHIVVKQPNRNLCVYFGNLILTIWKILEKEEDDEGADSDKRTALEADVITDLFFNAIMVKKIFSEKFYWMIDGLRDDTNKKVNYMLFRCAQPVLWRNLDVPNGVIRFAASMVMLKLYPFQSEDKFMNIEYLEKQHKAMKGMLTDSCVDIRVEATKRILMHMSLWWVVIPREFIKDFLAIIIDNLAYDTSVDVRVAVYEGLQYLLPCAPALNAMQHALKLLGNSGINDKSERVRLAMFKLLNGLKGHRFIKYYEVVEMEDILYRLDFEYSDAVKLEIAKLLCKTYCPLKKATIDERYNRVRHLVKTSRNAALQFHRLIFSNNLVPLEIAMEHIISLSTGVCLTIRSATGGDASMNQSAMDVSNASQLMTNLKTNKGQTTIDFSLFDENKSIIDCAIVLWTTLRKRLYSLECSKENDRINQHMGKVMMRLFDDQYRNTVLMESALVIGSLLPEKKSDACYSVVHNMIESGDLDSDFMPHYIEAYATWDMNKMIEIIYNGLKELRLSFEYSSTRSPPKKKTKPTADKFRRPLEFINMILASANLHTYVIQRFGEHLPEFYYKLKTCKECIPQLTIGGPSVLNEKLVILVYETYVLLSIIVNKEEPVVDKENEEGAHDDPLLGEINWFFLNFRPSKNVFSNNFLQAFLRCTLLYVESKPHSLEVFQKLTDLLKVMYEYSKRDEGNCVILKTLEETTKATKESVKYATDGNGDSLIKEQLVPLIDAINS